MSRRREAVARVARILKDLSGPRRGPRPAGGPLGRVLVLVPLIGSLVRRGPRA